MNHNQLSDLEGNPEIPASREKLCMLRDRIDVFVQKHSPRISFPEGTQIVDTRREVPRPLLPGQGIVMSVYVNIPGSLIYKADPGVAQRLQAEELSFIRDVPTYSYRDESIPTDPQNVDMDKVIDTWWPAGGGSGIYVAKTPEVPFESTFYKLSNADEFSRSSEPREGDPWPTSNHDPEFMSEQECVDINIILSVLESLGNEELIAKGMNVEVD